jgi:hypothetical protein
VLLPKKKKAVDAVRRETLLQAPVSVPGPGTGPGPGLAARDAA